MQLHRPRRHHTGLQLFAIRFLLFAKRTRMRPSGAGLVSSVCAPAKPCSSEPAVDLRLSRTSEKQRASLCVAGTKCTGLGNAAVDFDGDNASGMVQFEGRWSVEHSIAVQARQCDKHPVLDARCRGIAFQEGEGVIVTAHLGQHEAEVGYIPGFRHRYCRLDGDPRLYLISLDLDLRFEANVILESRFRIERTPINLKRHTRAS